MKPTATFRFITAFLMLASLLFTQLATAAYVCPTNATKAPPVSTATLPSAATPNASSPCQHQDAALPGLCHASASDVASKLSLDKPNAPDVEVFMPVQMAQTIYFSDVHPALHNSVRRSRSITSSSAPATILLHCCFRI